VVQPEDEKKENAETQQSIEGLTKALAEEKARAEENMAGWKRAQADFVNYKKFAEQEKADICALANAGLLSNILPVVDDFERALSTIPEEKANQSWVEGFNLIRAKLNDTLKKQGVTQVQALGMEFDPRKMDAISCCPGKRDIVIQEVEKGYMLNDKVIRPAKVVVGTGEEVKEE